MNKFFHFLLFFIISPSLLAVNMAHQFYTHFDESDGLPDVAIKCCAQDEFGRIWVGSQGEGIYLYAGSRFVKFENEDYLNSCSSFVNDIEVDKDSRIWIATQSGAGFYSTYTDEFTAFEELKGARVIDVSSDPNGDVWLTTDYTMWKYSQINQELTIQIRTSEYSPRYFCFTDDGILIFTTGDQYLYCYDLDSGTLWTQLAGNESSILRYIEYIGDSSVLVSDGHRIVFKYNLSTEEKEIVVDESIIESVSEIRCLSYANGCYWIGTTFGLIVYNPETGDVERQYPDNLDTSSLGGEFIMCLFQDKDGNIWAGTRNGGLRSWMYYENGYGRYTSSEYINSIAGNTIRSICEGPDGRIWLGSEEGYLCSYNPDNKFFEKYSGFLGVLSGTWISSMAFRGEELWIATSGKGVYVFDTEKGRPTRHYDLPNKYCLSIIITENGSIYTGTAAGLYQYNYSEDAFNQVIVLGDAYIRTLIEDGNGNIYVGTSMQGVGLFDVESETYKGLISEVMPAITGLLLDSDSSLWVATDGGGVYKLEMSSDNIVSSISHINKNTGMPSNRIGGIVKDHEGTFWISSTNGLVEIESSTLAIRKVYMQKDDVLGEKFSFGGCLMSSSGAIYMGSSEGLLVYRPEFIKQKFQHSRIHITEIVLGNLDSRQSISQKGRSCITSEEIKVRQKDASFMTLSYSSMDYSNPNREEYKCTLERPGFKNTFVTDNKNISYTNLRPGIYEFTVNFNDTDNKDTEAKISINIVAPWYLSIWAGIIYLLIIIYIVFLFMRLIAKKREKEAADSIELYKAKKERDLANEKTEFFLNVAHEIRTPVSIILILLDRLFHSRIPEEMKDDLSSIQSNTERLKKQCDELLDFRNLEKGKVQMFFKGEDICTIARKSISSFETAASIKGISMDVNIPNSPLKAVCDANAIESIICNLISNAIKYGQDKISLSIKDVEDIVEIRVNSNGNRISENESEKIFDAFYQSDSMNQEGSGIGLTYSRQLASMHNGRLFLDTECEDSNSFVLIIPKTQSYALDEDVRSKKESEESAIDKIDILEDERKSTILIAENNDEMRHLLRDELINDYDILEMCNGQEALDILRKASVDLVISDIVMPEMDGCELCNSIKEDIHLSHIPVILITAAVGMETHLRTLKSGADGYFEKPFKMSVLKASIRNILRNRRIRDIQFSQLPLSHITKSSFNEADKDFINTFTNLILDNLSDPKLSIDKLADMMSVSRNTLTGRVKASMGVTVNDFIRICRMKKAVELIKENKYRINEVAYRVGYVSASYFSKTFMSQFGVLPSQFMSKGKTPK